MNSSLRRRASKGILAVILIASLLTACNLDVGRILTGLTPKTPVVEPPIETNQNLPLAEVIFNVSLTNPAPSEDVSLEIVDEVTGLALNPKRYEMESAGENNTFQVTVPIVIGSDVKYRFIRPGSPTAIEYTAGGNQVRYRIFHVDGPTTVNDVVAGWSDQPYSGAGGRITGQIIDKETNSPVPSILVTAGGEQTITASDGTFLLEGLAPGVHNLVAFSLNGNYGTFQQGAMVAENATTPSTIYVQAANTVKVTFVVQIPSIEISGLPIRLLGSTYALGNTFADLDGGLSTVASKAPVLSMIAENIYSITLELPVGLDLNYKYSLGDGFWNAEHTASGAFRLRQLIIPNSDLTVTDIIDNWGAGGNAPITFSVRAPVNTPSEDVVSIQFNPYGWTSPIPMWPLGDNQWLYVLYSPVDMFNEIKYRYCRNDQCGIADDSTTHVIDTQGRSVATSSNPKSVEDTVEAWSDWTAMPASTTIIAPEIPSRESSFVAGVELSENYSPTWQNYTHNGLASISKYGANWVILSPTWSYTHDKPAVLEPVPGRDPLWADTFSSVRESINSSLNVGLFPRIEEDLMPNGFWTGPIEDTTWWNDWFTQYTKFIINYADLAAQTQASMLILGGPDVTPALPGGTLADGSPSGVPENAVELWGNLLTEVRSRFTGQVVWAVAYPFQNTPVPEWISSVDAVYVLFSAPLTGSSTPNQGELTDAFARALDADLFPLVEQTGKPFILALNYPSADGAASGCVAFGEHCLPFDFLSQPTPLLEQIVVDTSEQLDIYNAALNALVSRQWVTGFVSRGYYYPAALQDTSPSVNGKPAADVLWYWYPKLLGK